MAGKQLKTCPNKWMWKDKEFSLTYEDILEQKLFGFIYLIGELETGKKYIGEKGFHSFRTPTGKVNKKKQESNWAKYPSSNKVLQLHIRKAELERNEKFKFTILALCKDKPSMKLEEIYWMMHYKALMREDFLNDNLKCNILCTLKDYDTRVLH